MKTTIDHLLTPRFEVIGPYPNSPYKVGDIMDNHGSNDFHITTTNEWSEMHNDNVNVDHYVPVKRFLEYPNLFRPLQWWEKRTEDEMPKYLKGNYSGEIDYIKVDAHFKHYAGGWRDSSFQIFSSGRSSFTYPGWEPCSEEEYLNNMNR